VSLWLSYTLFTVGHPLLGVILLAAVIVKLIGLIYRHSKLKTIGIIGLNIIWAVNITVFLSDYHPAVPLTWEIPFFVLLLGIGISLRGRYRE